MVRRSSTRSARADLGFTPRMTVAGAWLVLFSTFGYLNAYGVCTSHRSRPRRFGADFVCRRRLLSHPLPARQEQCRPGVAGQLASLPPVCREPSPVETDEPSLTHAQMGLISGKLFDEGYFHYMLFGGSVLYVFCLMMVSLSTSYYSIILSQGVGLGLANGILFIPSIGAVSHHFLKRRALATGIVVTGSSVGGIVFPISASAPALCARKLTFARQCSTTCSRARALDGPSARRRF